MQIELGSKDLFLIKLCKFNSSPETLSFIDIRLGDFRRTIRNCLVSAVLSGLNSKIFLHIVSMNIISNITSVDILNNSVPWIPEAKFITFFFFSPQSSIPIMQRYIFFFCVGSERGRYWDTVTPFSFSLITSMSRCYSAWRTMGAIPPSCAGHEILFWNWTHIEAHSQGWGYLK